MTADRGTGSTETLRGPSPRAPGERLADQRLRLQGLATSLAQSLDPRGVASLMLDAACGLLDAPKGWVAVVAADGRHAEILDSRGYPPEVVGPWTRLALELRTPMTDAIREQRAIIHRTRLERDADYPTLEAAGLPTAASEASAVIPFSFEGRTTGALAIAFEEQRELDDDERWYLGALAAQGSQSLERARLFSALQEREERMRFALSASRTGTWEWNVAGDTLEWSPEVATIHGTPPGWAPPSFDAYLELVHPADRPRIAAAIELAVGQGLAYDEEFRIVLPDGTVRWVQGMGRVQLDDAGAPLRMLGTALDITDRKHAEEARDRFIEAEREGARLRDAFIGVVSHELRTPITTIFGGTRVLARRWREMDPDARDAILTDVVEEADRLYRLVEDLLVLTRVERGTLDIGDEPIHLGRVLERVVASERARWPGVTIETRIQPGLPSVAGEDTYIEQVLRNLLGNAAKYGGSGSTVTVTAGSDAATPEGGTVTLAVHDEGPGIRPEEAEDLFQLFYRSPTVAGSVSGAGIGLFVCRQLVGAMGGTIRAERRPEGGATFLVTLPRYADDEVG